MFKYRNFEFSTFAAGLGYTFGMFIFWFKLLTEDFDKPMTDEFWYRLSGIDTLVGTSTVLVLKSTTICFTICTPKLILKRGH